MIKYGNLLGFDKKYFSNKLPDIVKNYQQYLPTERMGEILIKIPFMPKEWFYYCGKGPINFDVPPFKKMFGGSRKFKKHKGVRKSKKSINKQ